MGQMSREEIVDFLREHRSVIAQRFGVTSLGLETKTSLKPLVREM